MRVSAKNLGLRWVGGRAGRGGCEIYISIRKQKVLKIIIPMVKKKSYNTTTYQQHFIVNPRPSAKTL